jgi:hypothetical protein
MPFKTMAKIALYTGFEKRMKSCTQCNILIKLTDAMLLSKNPKQKQANILKYINFHVYTVALQVVKAHDRL